MRVGGATEREMCTNDKMSVVSALSKGGQFTLRKGVHFVTLSPPHPTSSPFLHILGSYVFFGYEFYSCGRDSKLLKLLLLVATDLGNAENVEADGLGEGAALANSHLVAELGITEDGGDVGRESPVALLKAVVLLDVVEVVTADDAGPAKGRGVG